MKKRILSILLLCCMVLTMMPATVFAADGEVAARASETGGLYEHHEACGADPAGASDTMMPKTRSGAVRPAATQYTYTLHYDANGGSGAPPSQSVTSSEFAVWVPISEIIPTRDGYTFIGWANYRTGTPIYGGNGGYTECLVVHGVDMSTTIYAIWEVHNHSWGEWTSNGNGTHTRTCTADSSHTETGNCSGGKATSTEKAVCETCHTAYGELLQPAKTVITTPPTLPLPGYIGNEYTDRALRGGEAKAESTGVVVPGTFRFKHYEGGRVYPGENSMEILFTPDDTEAYTTAECIITVTGTKRTVTRVPDDVIITNKPIGTAFENLGLPSGVKVETNTGASYSPVPVTWDDSTYNPNKYGEQIITGELHVEKSGFTDGLEPTNTVKATARITLIDDRVFTPTLEPPTYSKQLYGGDLCFLVFADKYLSGGTATVNGETVSGKFTLDKDQKIYGHSLTASTLLQAGQLQLKIIFTPDNLKRYNKAKCTVDVNVVPRTFKETRAGHITNEKFGTPFEELNLSDSFSFYAVGDEKDPEGTGMDFGMNVVTSWDSSTYDPNSFEEQTIYGEVNRAELKKYFTIPDGTDLRAVRKVQLQPDPAETEITQLPVFRWKNGDFTLPDNTIFTWRKLQVGTYNGEVGTLVGGVAKVKGADTVAPGTFSFKNAPPFYLQTPGEHDVTVVFTPDDLRLHKSTEITIKINAVKNTIKDIDEPNPITDKPFGTPFAELGLPEDVCINAVDGAWRWVDVAWDESSYDAESVDWQTIIGTPVLSEDDGDIFQQPEPAVTAAIRVKLIDNRPPMPPTIVAESLPDGMEGEAYSNRLTAKGTAPITWSIVSGVLPGGLSLNEDTGEISGTPAGEGTEVFTVMAVNDLGEDIKELSITIVKAPEAEYAVTVRDDGHGTGSADPASATAGTEITLTATPNAGYHFKEWQVMSGDVTVRDDKFTMPSDNVEIKAIFEEDAPPTPTEYTVTVKTDGNGTASASHAKAVVGTEITLTATPNAGYHFKEWQVMSGDVTVRDDKFTMPGSDVEVKAIFEEDAPPTPTEYTVTFDGNDGTPSVGSMTTTEQKLTSLPDASRSKHSFNGWYTEKSGGTKITTNTVFSANTTVYAHWTHTGDNNPPVNYYTLRFETGGGSAIPGVRETYNTYMDLTKYVPTRHGYTFVGWYSEQSLVNKVSDIYLTGDRTVYAGWRAVTIPQTGDGGQMNLWSTALCASFAGCVALIVWKIRRREKKSL
ncbi:InlB B-repeat-containing protein [Hominenteromicrobium sp.]|uniref:InlB B-repeat-containing protein n=1 Tax=Hominenteromicrobium sp. TaxID=3073581 RepID=UPI003AB8DFE0